MKISNEKPPNWDILEKTFGVEWGMTVVTYGDTIYCGIRLSDDVIAHESVHIKQQAEMGVKTWWERFLDDSEFRYNQELEAYKYQYRFLQERIKDRNQLSKHAVRIASYLSGDMYGNVVTRSEALRAIRT